MFKDINNIDRLTDQQRSSFSAEIKEGMLPKGTKLWKFISNNYDDFWKKSVYWFPTESLTTIFEIVNDRLNQGEFYPNSASRVTNHTIHQMGAITAFERTANPPGASVFFAPEKQWVYNTCQYLVEIEVKTELPSYRGVIGPQHAHVEITEDARVNIPLTAEKMKNFTLGGVEQVVLPRLAKDGHSAPEYFIYKRLPIMQTSWAKRFAFKYM